MGYSWFPLIPDKKRPRHRSARSNAPKREGVGAGCYSAGGTATRPMPLTWLQCSQYDCQASADCPYSLTTLPVDIPSQYNVLAPCRVASLACLAESMPLSAVPRMVEQPLSRIVTAIRINERIASLVNISELYQIVRHLQLTVLAFLSHGCPLAITCRHNHIPRFSGSHQ